MQASCKEALPLFGSLGRLERGERDRSRHREESTPLSSGFLNPGNPRSIRNDREGPAMREPEQDKGAKKATRPSQEIKAGCDDDSRVTTPPTPILVALSRPPGSLPTRKPVPELNPKTQSLLSNASSWPRLT